MNYIIFFYWLNLRSFIYFTINFSFKIINNYHHYYFILSEVLSLLTHIMESSIKIPSDLFEVPIRMRALLMKATDQDSKQTHNKRVLTLYCASQSDSTNNIIIYIVPFSFLRFPSLFVFSYNNEFFVFYNSI